MKQEKHLHSRNNARSFAVPFALAVTVFALALSPLASCASSNKPQEVIKPDSPGGSLFFIGIDENWIYYELLPDTEDPTCTIWRAKKDGTSREFLATLSSESYHYDITLFNGRLYYLTSSDLPQTISSSPTDYSQTITLTGKADFYSHLTVTNEWICFVGTDYTGLPDGQGEYANGLYAMKPDGSSLTEIAAPDASIHYSDLLVANSRLYYIRTLQESGHLSCVIAMRDVQGGEETIIARDEHRDFGSLSYSDGFLFYARPSMALEGDRAFVCTMDTQAPYSEKTLVSGEYGDEFKVAFVKDGWVYFEKSQLKYISNDNIAVNRRELWRVRTDGRGAECLADNGLYPTYLALDGDYIYYEMLSDDESGPGSILYRMKTP